MLAVACLHPEDTEVNDGAAAGTSPSREEGERAWLAAARAGDPEAFRRLVEWHQDRVFTFLLRIVKQREEAEDLAQETFVRAWRHLARYDERWAFRTWLFGIARHLALNALRRPRATIVSLDGGDGDEPGPARVLAAAGPSPADEAAARERRQRLAGAVANLAPRAAMIFTLFYQEELSIAEIARAIDMSPGAVKVALHRLREALRKQLTG